MNILEATVRELARTLISEFTARGTCEAVVDYARPLASAMFMKLMDWPLEDTPELERLTDMELNGPPDATTVDERNAGRQQAIIELDRYAMAQIALRHAAPAEAADMTTVIMNSTLADGGPIGEKELASMLRLLSIAGLDTTQSVMSQTLAYLGTHPEAQEYVRENRAEIPRLVEEFLRFNTPAMPSRVATVDYVVDGVQIAAGDTMHLLLSASNRDEQEFENPLVIDVHPHGQPSRHLRGRPAQVHRCRAGPGRAGGPLWTSSTRRSAAIPSWRPILTWAWCGV